MTNLSSFLGALCHDDVAPPFAFDGPPAKATSGCVCDVGTGRCPHCNTSAIASFGAATVAKAFWAPPTKIVVVDGTYQTASGGGGCLDSMQQFLVGGGGVTGSMFSPTVLAALLANGSIT